MYKYRGSMGWIRGFCGNWSRGVQWRLGSVVYRSVGYT